MPNYWGPFAQLKEQTNAILEVANYNGLMAELNDALFIDRSDIAYYVDLAKEAGGPILELGCGSGRVTLPLLSGGYHVTGVDNSQDMLDILSKRMQHRSREEQSRLTMCREDARNFQLGNAFSLVIFPYCSLLLFTDPADRKSILKSVRRHLTSSGLFAFDAPVQESLNQERIFELDLPIESGKTVVTLGIKTYHEQKVMLENSLFQVAKSTNKRYTILEYKKLALFAEGELEQELQEAGFYVYKRIPTLSDNGKTLRYLYVCGKSDTDTYPLWHPYMPHNQLPNHVLTLVSGQGCRVTDQHGKTYIDASGGLWSVQCGLGNTYIIDAITKQLSTLSYGTLFAGRGNEPALALARKLVELAPYPLEWVYLTGSGSESVELSIKLARQFWHFAGLANKNRIVYLDQSYHGTFFGSMGVSGLYPAKETVGPGLPGLDCINAPNPDNCPPNQDYETYALTCAEQLETVARLKSDQIAAFIIEPVLGSAGVVIPPQAYFDRIAEICQRHNILLIVDEIATGFGRTGAWFCSTHFGIKPDIMLLSKGITSGYLPLGATLFSAEIGNRLLAHGAGIMHGSSHNGNPACCVAALATIDVLTNQQLIKRAREAGHYVRELLEQMKNEQPNVSGIRSLGLMAGVALCQNDHKPATKEQVAVIYELLKRKGVLAYPAVSSVVFFPALTITDDELQTVVQKLGEVLSSVQLVNNGTRMR
ncbi:aminotransferase class III-fold pyridoxal phosphate-dependent enzyme [Spirosoma montaniterrae]|uniref:Methyltransferase domain-containing protein n=1 Tax=Spirosoma montaniterrae TaxID=1178516 RepID=A0A1P9WW18_9BACT|nr:aminotransferase class III-fold pyridoxal phosphate-dependent enzyme [Spirosoma montaniterrae]AQG79574.1 hypothetical protein AWR27_09700 [Spirosoma montaniterrae]